MDKLQIPPLTPIQFHGLIKFLGRATISGSEAVGYVDLMQALERAQSVNEAGKEEHKKA